MPNADQAPSQYLPLASRHAQVSEARSVKAATYTELQLGRNYYGIFYCTLLNTLCAQGQSQQPLALAALSASSA